MEPEPEERNLERDNRKRDYGRELDHLRLLRRKLKQMEEKNLTHIQIHRGYTVNKDALREDIDASIGTLRGIGQILGVDPTEVEDDINEGEQEGEGFLTRDPTTNPPSVRKYLEKRGNDPIFKIKIIRTPLSASTKLLLNVATLGGVKQAMQNANIDELFHLAMIINDDMLLEKNEVINLRKAKSSDYTDKTQTLDVPVTNQDLTYNQLFENTQKKMGQNYGTYNAKTNNCSVFISNVLSANGLDTAESNKFINQKTEQLFQSFPSLSEKLVNLATSLGASVDRLLKGEGISDISDILDDYDVDPDPNLSDIELQPILTAILDDLERQIDEYQQMLRDRAEMYTQRQLNNLFNENNKIDAKAKRINKELMRIYDEQVTVKGNGHCNGQCMCGRGMASNLGSQTPAPPARAKF